MSVLILLSPIFSICNVILFLRTFFNIEFKITKYKFLLLLFFYNILLVSQILENTLLYLALNILYIIITSMILSNKADYKIFLLVIIALISEALIQGVIEKIVIYFIGKISLFVDFSLRIIMSLIFLILYNFNKRKRRMIVTSKENMKFIAMISLVATIIGIIMQINMAILLFPTFTFIICIIAKGCCILITAYYIKQGMENLHYQKEISLKEQVIALQEENIEQTVKSYQHLRIFKHDIRSYLQTIQLLLEKQNYDELGEYIQEIYQEVKPAIFSNCPDIYITVILQMFEKEIIQEKYIFNFNYDIIGRISMKNTYKSSLFYNLLKNAIEELQRIEKKNEKKLSLSIGAVNGTLVVNLENTIENNESIKKIMTNTTSKMDKENHGLGLFSIKKIVDEYDGEIEYEVTKNSVIVRIYIMDVIIND